MGLPSIASGCAALNALVNEQDYLTVDELTATRRRTGS